MKTRAIALAIKKVVNLPEVIQEEIIQEVLMRVDALVSLRSDIETGRREIEVGRGRRLAFDDLLQELQEEYGAQE